MTLTAQILELIDKSDSFEIVRDRIAEILLVESAKQQELAALAVPEKDPDLWKLRVFTEATNPWQEFLEAEKDGADLSPVVDVSWDNSTFDKSKGDVVERQQAVGVFFIDCYGCAISRATDDGHSPGDQDAAVEVQRAIRLVRNIILGGAYTYLGFPKSNRLVAGRWPQSITALHPASDVHPVQHVKAARLALEVTFNEFSPQVQGVPLQTIGLTLKRQETGEVYLEAQYGTPDPPP